MLFKVCSLCHKNKLFVKTRSYKVDKISPFPINSKGEYCIKCHNKLKKVLKLNI